MPQTSAEGTAVVPADLTLTSAYAAIKQLEAQNLIPFPQTSKTVHVGTLDGTTNKFTYDVQTGTESYVTYPPPGGGGNPPVVPSGGGNPVQPKTSRPIPHHVKVGYVLVYATDLQLSFSVVNARSSFTVKINGQTATATSGNVVTIDLKAYTTPPQSQLQVPGTEVILQAGPYPNSIQLRILRPPVCTAGSFTIPAIPTAIIYAPPPGPEKKNFAIYTNVTTVSNKISTTVSNGSSTKTAKAYSVTDFIDKISGFAGDVANFASSIASFAGGAPAAGGASGGAVGGLLGFLGAVGGAIGVSGTPPSQGSAQNDLKAIGSGIKLFQDIVDGLSSTMTTNSTSLANATTENDLQTTDTLTLTEGTQAGLGPGVGDRIGFLLNVKVGWAILDNELSYTILGYDGTRTFAVQTLGSDLALLNSGTSPSQTQTQLDAATIQNLLSLDPLVQNASASALTGSRFVQNNPPSIGGSGNDSSGDLVTTSHMVLTTDITTQQNVTTTLTDTKPGWLGALLGFDSNTSTETVTTMTYTSGITQTVGQTVTSGVTFFASTTETANTVSLYFDTIFGTFVFLPFDPSGIPIIDTVFDLNGIWESGGTPGPVISVSGNAISVNMSAYNRPTATGSVVDSSDITVTFPDASTYTGRLQAPGTIVWSNNSSWTKSSPGLTTVLDLNGTWASGGAAGPVISVTGSSISVDMSAYKRPTATGSILDASDIKVAFPDDTTYTAKLQPPGTILWSNNSAWTKVTLV